MMDATIMARGVYFSLEVAAVVSNLVADGSYPMTRVRCKG